MIKSQTCSIKTENTFFTQYESLLRLQKPRIITHLFSYVIKKITSFDRVTTVYNHGSLPLENTSISKTINKFEEIIVLLLTLSYQ